MKVDKFPFHKLLTTDYIPDLEKMIKTNDLCLEVKRLGKYQLSKTKKRDFSIATYMAKDGSIWYIDRI